MILALANGKSCLIQSMNIANNPLVTIITPAFNSASFIAEAIDSVICQTYKNWELLIVDDCSTDNTAEIATAYASKDKRIRVHALESNSGLPAVPRNYALKIAKGKYLTFLDSDDLWLREKLEKQVFFMEKNSEVFLSYSNFFCKKNNIIFDKIQPDPKVMCRGRVFRDLFLSDNFIPCLTVIFRNQNNHMKYLFDENPGFKAIEDFDLWLRIAKDNNVDFIDEPLAIYRLHDNNSSKGFFVFFRRLFKVLRKWENEVPLNWLMLKYLLSVNLMLSLILSKILSFAREQR